MYSVTRCDIKEQKKYLEDFSTWKLDVNDLFENENHGADSSTRHKPIAEFYLWVEEIMAEISQVVTISSWNKIIEQSTRSKQNLLLESELTYKETRNIGDITNQGLESEKSKETHISRNSRKKEVMRKERSQQVWHTS